MLRIAYAVAAHCLAPKLTNDAGCSVNVSCDVPDGSFGVFVTVRRSVAKITWPHDVHGCIGYWCPDFCAMTSAALWRKAFSVGYSAMYDDDRRMFFDDIRGDADARIVVSFMQLPVVTIDSDTGTLRNTAKTTFNNQDFGVIVDESPRHATYLPGVFPPDASWHDIRDSVVKKATRRSSSSATPTTARFYAYRTVTRSVALSELLYSNETTRTLAGAFCRVLLKGYTVTGFVPYTRTQNGTFSVNAASDVRNVSTIVAGSNFNRTVFKSKALDGFLRHDVALFRRRSNTLSEQALAFLFPELTPTERRPACVRLASRVPRAELVFERGELIKAAATYCQYSGDDDGDGDGKTLLMHRIKDIFQWNWDSQALSARRALRGKTRASYARWVLQWFSQAAVQARETNELAVFLEGVKCYIFADNVEHVDSDTDTDVTLRNAALHAFLEAMTRFGDGLFVFRHGKGARFDISVHVLNGLAIL